VDLQGKNPDFGVNEVWMGGSEFLRLDLLMGLGGWGRGLKLCLWLALLLGEGLKEVGSRGAREILV
jgi:hypothetical protein